MDRSTPDPDSSLPRPPARPARTLTARFAGMTDRGLVRELNEDDFLIAELAPALRVRQSKLPQVPERIAAARAHLLVVADGMGGHSGGDVASVLAVGAVVDCLLEAFGALSF